MSEVTISFTIQGDNEGYVTFECPHCNSEFKLQAGEFQNDDEPFCDLFCPYCGLSKDKTSFYSKEVLDKAKALVTNEMVDKINRAFGGMERSVARGKSMIKMTVKPLKKVTISEIVEKDTAEVEFECKVCHHHVKTLYCVGASKIFCPYCGVDL